MTKPFDFCRHLLPAAVMLAAATAPAQGETRDTSTVWKGNTVRDSNGQLESCAVIREFEDGSVLSFALTRDQDFFLVVSNPQVHLPRDGIGTVRYMVDDGLAYEAPAEAMRQSVIIDLPDTSALRELLSNGNFLFLNELGDIGYSLKGAKQSLRALSDCVERALAAESAPVKAPAPAATDTAAPAAAEAPSPVATTESGLGPFADLGVYDAEATARVDWLHMKKTTGGLLDSREPMFVTRTRSKDGRAFTVLRLAGFADRDEAARFCKALQAKKRECTLR